MAKVPKAVAWCNKCAPGAATPLGKSQVGINVFEAGMTFYSEENEKYPTPTIELFVKCQGEYIKRFTATSNILIRFCPFCGRRLNV